MFCFLAHSCFVFCTLLHFIVRTWLKSHFCMAIVRIALALRALPGLTDLQFNAGDVTLTRQMRKMIQMDVWCAKKMSNIL